MQLISEVKNPGSTYINWMELTLLLLKSSDAVIAVEMLHCYLVGIYYYRQDISRCSKHAEAVVKLIFENKLYFPLFTYYRYFAGVFAPVIERYPKDFKEHCNRLISQYNENLINFITSIREHAVLSTFTDVNFPYIHGVLMGLKNSDIADKLGVHPQTVRRKIQKICDELSVKTKKELREYLRNNM